MKPAQNARTDKPGIQKPGYDPMDEKQARAFDETSTTVFAPIYPVLAGQILELTKKRAGTALDIGSGPALLAIALAQESDLRVFALDYSPMMLMIASEHIREAGLVKRVTPVFGDVHEIPFEDNSVDLVVSRGSWFFWNNLCNAFLEIFRVLTPGGCAYIGGGFGNAILKEQIFTAMRKRKLDWDNEVQGRFQRNNPEYIRDQFQKAGILSYRLIQDESGFWAVIQKEA